MPLWPFCLCYSTVTHSNDTLVRSPAKPGAKTKNVCRDWGRLNASKPDTKSPKASQPASLAKKTFVHSDIYNYSTRQNKVEQSRTVDQRFEQWIKGSSKKKVHRKKKVHQKKVHEKGPLEKINWITKFSIVGGFSVFTVDSSQHNLSFNIL